MVIYAKITIEREYGETKKAYIALMNSGAGLTIIDPELDFLPILYLLVPWEVAEELGVAREDIVRRGKKYWVDPESQYIVCLYDPYDKPIKCMKNVLLVVEDGLDEILIPYEFLAVAGIDLRPSRHSWICQGREIPNIFRVKSARKLDKELLKYTRYRRYIEQG